MTTLVGLRQDRGLNQYEFADAVGVQQSAVSRAEGRSLYRMRALSLRDYVRLFGGDVFFCVVTPDGDVTILKDPDPVAGEGSSSE